jgi:chromosome partitioning protein
VESQDLVGVFEIAEMAGVTSQAVANWRARLTDFPQPVANLRSGPVFRREDVRRWLRNRRSPLAKVIATINLKGGVAKTTTTVAVAEILSAEFGKRVLLVDIDPQTNATATLIGDQKWKALNEKGFTLARLFQDSLLDRDARVFDLEKTLQKKVSTVKEVQSLDLLPSSLDLLDIRDRLGSMGTGRFFAENPIDILNRAVRPVIDEYDYVLIDCPPDMGIITLNGLKLSDYYIIPTIPDFLSTYGIPQIVTRVRDFAETIGKHIEPLGIVITKYREQSTVHRNGLARLKQDNRVPLFKTVIPEKNEIAASAEDIERSTLRQKYGYQGGFDLFRALTVEIMKATGP